MIPTGRNERKTDGRSTSQGGDLPGDAKGAASGVDFRHLALKIQLIPNIKHQVTGVCFTGAAYSRRGRCW